jgi:hypothetical protein
MDPYVLRVANVKELSHPHFCGREMVIHSEIISSVTVTDPPQATRQESNLGVSEANV